MLVEAKAHIEELESKCGAKEHGGLPMIREALRTTIEQLGIKADVASWLEPYYQYANRLAVLSFLHSQNITARLINIYFVGDISRPGLTGPQSIEEWQPHIAKLETHLGLSSGHRLTPFVHELFLDIASETMQGTLSNVGTKETAGGSIKRQRTTSSHHNSKTITKSEPKIILNLQPGPISPSQREAGRKFWAKLISEVKADASKYK